jgi:hypothetical protein
LEGIVAHGGYRGDRRQVSTAPEERLFTPALTGSV